MAVLKELIKKLLSSVGLKMGGVAGWLLQLILSFLTEKLWIILKDAWEEYQRRKKREEKVNEALKQYEESIGQKLSREERRKRAEELLNSIDE